MLDCSWEYYIVTIDTLANAVAATSGFTCFGLKRNDQAIGRTKFIIRPCKIEQNVKIVALSCVYND
jgi:hypothetical protein